MSTNFSGGPNAMVDDNFEFALGPPGSGFFDIPRGTDLRMFISFAMPR